MGVKYNTELFDLLKDLTSINNQVIIEREEGNVLVRRADVESTIAYQLKAPGEYFEFDNEKVGFYNYVEFYQSLKALSNTPELEIEEKRIVFKDNNSKGEYSLSDPESLQKSPKSINFKDPDVKMNLASADLGDLIKWISLTNAKKAQIYGSGNKLTIKIFSQIHDNNFEKTFDVERLNESDEEIDFVIFSDTFEKLPSKRDYTMEIRAQGFVKISLVDENIKLDVFTGRVKS
jgi:hypothetical protein